MAELVEKWAQRAEQVLKEAEAERNKPRHIDLAQEMSAGGGRSGVTRFVPRPGRADLMKQPVYAGKVAMKNGITGEVVVVVAGSPELAALRRQRHPQLWHRSLWTQAPLPHG